MTRRVVCVLVVLALAAGTGEAEDVQWQVPQGFRMTRPASGPNGTTVAFLSPELWCAADARREISEGRRIATFDPEGRLLLDANAAGIQDIQGVIVQKDGSVLVWGWHIARVPGTAPRSSVLFRLGRAGYDESFQSLTPSDLGDMRLTSVSLAGDDSIEIEGSFTSVRGQPRPGRARLRPDGSLDD